MRKAFAITVAAGVPIVLGFVYPSMCRYISSCETGPGLIMYPYIGAIYTASVLLAFLPSLVCETFRGKVICALCIAVVMSLMLAKVIYSPELNETMALWALLLAAYISVPAIIGLAIWPNKSLNQDAQ